MITSIKQRAARLDPRTHLMSRIWLQMVVLILVVAMVLLLLLHLLLRDYFLSKSLDDAQVSASVASTALHDNYEQTLLGFLETCGTEDFEKLLAESDGKIVVDNGVSTMLDEDEIRRECQKEAAILWRKTGVTI